MITNNRTYNFIEIDGLEIPELEVYRQRNEVKLLRINEPDPGIFVCESAKVIRRAIEAGYGPISILTSVNNPDEDARFVYESSDKVPIYYGDEAGLCGWTDPDNRRTYPWGHEDKDLIWFHRDIIKIHKENEVLKRGSLMFLHGDHKVIAYGRFNRKDKIVVILNNNYEEVNLSLDVDKIGILNGDNLRRLILTTEDSYVLEPETYVVEKNELRITVPKISAVVLKAE